MVDLNTLEKITNELIDIYGIKTPPVPIESMLQRPPMKGMWDDLDASMLSGSFINVTDRYSPRMSLARLLARHIVSTGWGKERGLTEIAGDEATLYTFARMLMMPSNMLATLSPSARTPEWMSLHFEVPLEDAELRLQELA
jgi:hypothetical protein